MRASDENREGDLAAVRRLADAHGVRILYFGGQTPETDSGIGQEIHVEVETSEGNLRLAAAEFLLALEERFNQPVRLIHCVGTVREPVESLCLHGILEAVARAKALPVPSVLALLPDLELREKVVSELRLIGELAHRLPPAIQDAHPEVAWESAERYRNFLFVDNLDMQEVWEILRSELPRLASQVRFLVDQSEDHRPA